MARLCTRSTLSWSLHNTGPQTQFPYSSIGLTIALKSRGRVASSSVRKARHIMPNVRKAFATAEAACAWKVNDLPTNIPRSFSSDVIYSSVPAIVYWCSVFSVPRCITLHLSVLNGSCHLYDHTVSASKSLWSCSASLDVTIGLYTFVSSACIIMDVTGGQKTTDQLLGTLQLVCYDYAMVCMSVDGLLPIILRQSHEQ